MGWSISDHPYRLIEVDDPEANTKKTLRPSGLNHSRSLPLSVRLFGQRSAKGTG